MTARPLDRQSSMPPCPECGEPLDRHCATIWSGGVELQCPFPRRCTSMISAGAQCRRDARWFHHRIGWCAQHAPAYLKEHHA